MFQLFLELLNRLKMIILIFSDRLEPRPSPNASPGSSRSRRVWPSTWRASTRPSARTSSGRSSRPASPASGACRGWPSTTAAACWRTPPTTPTTTTTASTWRRSKTWPSQRTGKIWQLRTRRCPCWSSTPPIDLSTSRFDQKKFSWIFFVENFDVPRRNPSLESFAALIIQHDDACLLIKSVFSNDCHSCYQHLCIRRLLW